MTSTARPRPPGAVLAWLGALAGCAHGVAVERPERPVSERFAEGPPARPLLAPFAEGGAPEGPPAVASLELRLPSAPAFVLHGTLPVPPGTYPREDGRSPFQIALGPDRRVPAQVEIVSRNPEGEADVVEIAARVERRAEQAPGERARFAVLLDPVEVPAAPEVPAEVEALLRGDGPFELRTRDVFDHPYALDLHDREGGTGFGSRRVERCGPALRETRRYGTLVPLETSEPGEEDAPLPHLMGVHAYVTEWAGEGRVSLDLRVHNGVTAGSRPAAPEEAPVGLVYWRSLELVLPRGWRAVPLVDDPFFGPPRVEDGAVVVPLVAPLPDGHLHAMGPQAQFHRRLTLERAEGPARRAGGQAFLEGLAFCRPDEGLWSWFAPETAAYFPGRTMLATWGLFELGELRGHPGLRGRLFQERDALRATLRSGESGGLLVPAHVMGWAQPWFYKDQGVAGGVDIQVYEGHRTAAAASAAGYERLLLLHRMNACRQAEASWNRVGEPVGHDLWRDEDGVVPFDFRTNGRMVPTVFRLPCFGGPPASAQVRAVHERGLRPPYDRSDWAVPGGEIPFQDDELLAWMPHDGQHMVRYTKNTKALVWLGNDPLAKDDLILSGETFHLMFHESAHRQETWSEGVTLRQYEAHAEAHPHQGAYIGRDQAWGIDAMCAAYCVASPEWRARNRRWFDRVARLFERIAMPNGLLQRKDHPALIGHERYDAAQTYQCLFLLHAMRAMGESVFRGVDDGRRRRLEKLLLASLEYLYWKPVWGRARSSWQPPGAAEPLFEYGPRFAFAVGLKDGLTEPPFCDEERWGPDYLPEDGLSDGVEYFHCWWALEYGALASPETRGRGLENRYLRRVLDCWIRPGGYEDLVRRLFVDTRDASSDNSGNWTGLVGRLQSLGITTERELRRRHFGERSFYVDPDAVRGPEEPGADEEPEDEVGDTWYRRRQRHPERGEDGGGGPR